jgi:hypothetical protein
MAEDFDPNYYPQPLPSMAAIFRRRLEQGLTPPPPPPPEAEAALPLPPPPAPPVPPRQEPAGGGAARGTQQAAPVPVITPAPQPQQPSVLDMLRRRMQAQIDDESNQRLREIGIGMLRSESPNFFAALGQGLEAAETGSRSRMDRLRQIAEAERQQQELETRQAAQRAEEEYRRQTIGLRERELALGNRPQYTVVGQDADGNAIVVDMRNPTQRQTLQGVTPLQVASRGAQTETQNRQLAARLAEAAVNREATNRSNMNRPFSEADRATLRRQVEGDVLRSLGLEPVGGAGATTGTQGSQPSRVLTYPRTPE